MAFYSRGGAGNDNPYASLVRDPHRREWKQTTAPFRELFSGLFEGMGQEETASWDQLRGLMGQNVGQLGKTLSSQMGRTNVPMAGGWDMLARRYMAPMQTQMQSWMKTQQMPWHEKVGHTLEMAEKFWPMFKPHVGDDDYWKNIMNKFMKELFGGK